MNEEKLVQIIEGKMNTLFEQYFERYFGIIKETFDAGFIGLYELITLNHERNNKDRY